MTVSDLMQKHPANFVSINVSRLLTFWLIPLLQIETGVSFRGVVCERKSVSLFTYINIPILSISIFHL